MRMNTPAICATLMSLAYNNVTLTDLRPLGMTWLKVIENGASYAILTGDGYRVFIIPRGTNDWKDALWDLRFIKTDFAPDGIPRGRVHRGFYAAFMKIWPELKAELKKLDDRIPLIGGGHSLGGTMVQQIANVVDLQEAHVFGCPRTGNQEFVDHITCPGTRWEARFDPVTGVPFRFGPVQAISAWWQGREPTRFTQPPRWPAVEVDSVFHFSNGYRKAVVG